MVIDGGYIAARLRDYEGEGLWGRGRDRERVRVSAEGFEWKKSSRFGLRWV